MFGSLIAHGVVGSPRLARMVELLLIVILVLEVVGFWFGMSNSSKNPALGTAKNSPQATISLPDPKLLSKTPLFGVWVPTQTAKPKPVPTRTVAPSRFEARLVGTVVAGEHSAAILKIGGEQVVFFVGDTIRPGVTLHQVEEQAIVIERGGAHEKIEMQADEILPAPPPSAQMKIGSPLHSNRLQAGNQKSSPPPTRALWNRPFQSPSRVLKQPKEAIFLPHFVGGKAIGIRIANIPSGSFYAKAGLRNGDVIRRINGELITTPDQAKGKLNEAQKASSIEFEIMRAGRILQVKRELDLK